MTGKQRKKSGRLTRKKYNIEEQCQAGRSFCVTITSSLPIGHRASFHPSPSSGSFKGKVTTIHEDHSKSAESCGYLSRTVDPRSFEVAGLAERTMAAFA